MARSLFPALSGHTISTTIMHVGLLQLVLVVLVIGERCTRAVPSVQEYPAKKVHVLRRVPAACSNWDKAWSWLTKVDCGTKYKLDYVTVPPREVKQYKLEFVCCDGDTSCKEADNIHSRGFNSTDEKFLAIVLGSTAACVVIIIIVFAITFYTKKTRCYGSCDPESHVYASADGDESLDGNRDNLKGQPEDAESETDQKGSEVEYAEISYPPLPRYTDIFKENLDEKEDPFNGASAPPLYSAATDKNYINSETTAFPPMNSSSRDGITVVLESSSILREGTDNVFEDLQLEQSAAACLNGDSEGDVIYYNVKEKKRRKKRSTSSNEESTGSFKGEVRRDRGQGSTKTKCQGSGRRNKPSVSVSVEMIVKSSSASENIGKMSETSGEKQKRRSCPPDTVDVPIACFVQRNSTSTKTASVSSVSREDSSSACCAINETVVESHCPSNGRRKVSSARDSQQQIPVRKTSQSGQSSCYENSGVRSPLQSLSKTNSISNSSDVADLSNSCGLISPLNAVVLTCSDSTAAAVQYKPSQPAETDALLNALLGQSGAENVHTCVGCDTCSGYDRLQPVTPDSDEVSLHLYQCLDDVRNECQELEKCASKTPSESSLGKSDISHKSKRSISKAHNTSSHSLTSDSKKQQKPAPC